MEENEKDTQNLNSYNKRRYILLFCCLILPVVIAVNWNGIKGLILYFLAYKPPLPEFGLIDNHVNKLFQDFDADQDGLLTAIEFQRAYYHIKVKDSNVPFSDSAKSKNSLELENFKEDVKKILEEQRFDSNASEEVIQLNVSMKPFSVLTMKKFIDDPIFLKDDQTMFHLHGLSSWQQPNILSAVFPVSNFNVFLPKIDTISIASTWELIPKVLGSTGTHLTPKRYIPPNPEDNPAEKLLLYMMSMFHPQSFIHMRFPPRGAVCLLRAQNKDYYDIMVRFHPEFQLNTPPRYPFWFTPAAMVGNIVIHRDGSHIHSFDMKLPTRKSLNIDMEWITGEEEEKSGDDPGQLPGEVDIGFMEEMRLFSTGPSHIYGRNVSDTNNTTDIKWDEEITYDEGFNILEKEFYPFKKVNYVSFNETLKLARDHGKLIHHILLWGSLDDQSC